MGQASNSFKQTIQSYLENRSQTDSLFATKFENPKKNIDDCCTYILNTVQKSGNNGLDDEEVYGMAVHYYDEENVKVGSPVNAKVVVNHVVKLTEEDKEEARKAAIKKLQDEAYAGLTNKKPASKNKPQVQQNSLFADETEDEATI